MAIIFHYIQENGFHASSDYVGEKCNLSDADIRKKIDFALENGEILVITGTSVKHTWTKKGFFRIDEDDNSLFMLVNGYSGNVDPLSGDIDPLRF